MYYEEIEHTGPLLGHEGNSRGYDEKVRSRNLH
jgi:hypothetical protein